MDNEKKAEETDTEYKPNRIADDYKEIKRRLADLEQAEHEERMRKSLEYGHTRFYPQYR